MRAIQTATVLRMISQPLDATNGVLDLCTGYGAVAIGMLGDSPKAQPAGAGLERRKNNFGGASRGDAEHLPRISQQRLFGRGSRMAEGGRFRRCRLFLEVWNDGSLRWLSNLSLYEDHLVAVNLSLT